MLRRHCLILLVLCAALPVGEALTDYALASVQEASGNESWRCQALALDQVAEAVVAATVEELLEFEQLPPSGAQRARDFPHETIRWALVGLYVYPTSPPDGERTRALILASVYIMATEGSPMRNTPAEIAQLQALLR